MNHRNQLCHASDWSPRRSVTTGKSPDPFVRDNSHQPVRPHTASATVSAHTPSHRQIVSSSTTKSTGSPRFTSAIPKWTSPRSLSPRQPLGAADYGSSTESTNSRDEQLAINIDARSREHLEIKSCLLSYMHRIDVEELQQTHYQRRLEINRFRVQRLIAQGGVLDDGSVLDSVRRKTVFLLKHFFTLDERDSQNNLLYDVVDDWVCRSSSTTNEITAVWKSITSHIEQTYYLRRKLVAQADPDRLSILIAIDCLRKLAGHLPEYQRILDVCVTLIESGLFLSSTPGLDTISPSHRKVRFYFEEWASSIQSLESERELKSPDQSVAALECENTIPLSDQILELFARLGNDDPLEREKLFLRFLKSDMDVLASLACAETVKYFIGHPSDDKRAFFYSLLCNQLDPEAANQLFAELLASREREFKRFLHDNLPIMDSILLAGETGTGAVLHRLIDRHFKEFAMILWESPYLVSRVFNGSQHLIVRVLEQNSFVFSQTLIQRPDLLLGLMNTALRENTSVVEEFVVNHPRALSDLMVNKSTAIADIVKEKQFILTDLLQVCRATLGQALAAAPELVLHVLKSTPDILSYIVRADDNILSTIFKLAPQSLCDTLEKHPAMFTDIAHRKPTLVTKLFAENPDLLQEPLEANPILLTSFLAMHRNQLPDLSDPNFEAMLFHIQSKKTVDACVQTERPRLNSNSGKRTSGLCERSSLLRLVTHMERTASIVMLDKERKTSSAAMSSKNLIGGADMDLIPSATEIASEIIRLYAFKISSDNRDDGARRKRQSLHDFVLDIYIEEVGFMTAARKKLARLLLGAKRSEGIQESVRIKWFERFMDAGRDDKPVPVTGLDFYLAILQQLIPSDQLVNRLVDEPYHACVISQTAMRELVDHTLVKRLLESKDQRRRLLLLQTSTDLDTHILPSAITGTPTVGKAKLTKSMEVLHIDDVLDAIMNVWLKHQERIKDEWVVAFQRMAPDGSGVVHVNALKTAIRSKLPKLDDRTIMKIYHSCGQENELGEHALLPDEFAQTMSIIQERDTMRALALRAPSVSR